MSLLRTFDWNKQRSLQNDLGGVYRARRHNNLRGLRIPSNPLIFSVDISSETVSVDW